MTIFVDTKLKKMSPIGEINKSPRKVSGNIYTEQILHRWKGVENTILYICLSNSSVDVYKAGLVIHLHEVACSVGPTIEIALKELNKKCKLLVLSGNYDTWNY